jgi:hypothetical protein
MVGFTKEHPRITIAGGLAAWYACTHFDKFMRGLAWLAVLLYYCVVNLGIFFIALIFGG